MDNEDKCDLCNAHEDKYYYIEELDTYLCEDCYIEFLSRRLNNG